MENVWILGTGKSADIAEKCLNISHNDISGYFDNDITKQGKMHNHKKVYSLFEVMGKQIDFLIIATLHFGGLKEQLRCFEIPESKVIYIFNNNLEYMKQFDNIINIMLWKAEVQTYILTFSLLEQEKRIQILKENAPYECLEDVKNGRYQIPKITDNVELVNQLVNNKCSLCRFGDGEFEMMEGRERLVYQHINLELKEKLLEIISTKDARVLIAIANNYGSLEQYTEIAAAEIRKYLTPETRKKHYEKLDLSRTYYDAYISRPYLIYKDKENVGEKFDNIKRIWDKRDVVIVEGEHTRTGYGNDLLANAHKIKRILCPDKECFLAVKEIYHEMMKQEKEVLFLIVLGPTATILSYQAAQNGYQAVDIGQIDNEYEWYLQNSDTQSFIPCKTVSEIPDNPIGEIFDLEYQKQIIKIIQ